MNAHSCQSCLMPFTRDPGTREHAAYCSMCYRGGAFCYEGTNRREFQTIAYENMLKQGINPFLATFYSWMIAFAPRWRK